MFYLYVIVAIYLLGWVCYAIYLFRDLARHSTGGMKDLTENVFFAIAYGFLWWYWLYYQWKLKVK